MREDMEDGGEDGSAGGSHKHVRAAGSDIKTVTQSSDSASSQDLGALSSSQPLARGRGPLSSDSAPSPHGLNLHTHTSPLSSIPAPAPLTVPSHSLPPSSQSKPIASAAAPPSAHSPAAHPSAHSPAAPPSAHSPTMSSPDPLIWILGMAAESQGKYEQALLAYNTFLRQLPPLLAPSAKPLAPGVAFRMPAQPPTLKAGLSAAPTESLQPSIQQQQQQQQVSQATASVAQPYSLLTPVLAQLQPVIVQRAAACYSAVADWSQFHVFMSAQVSVLGVGAMAAICCHNPH